MNSVIHTTVNVLASKDLVAVSVTSARQTSGEIQTFSAMPASVTCMALPPDSVTAKPVSVSVILESADSSATSAPVVTSARHHTVSRAVNALIIGT